MPGGRYPSGSALSDDVMKKDKTKTPGYTISCLLLGLILFVAILYLKWWIFDREKEKDNRQTQEMVDYHRSEGRAIQTY